MEVIEDTHETFHIASQPSLVSQAVFFGFFAFGFALSFYSDSIFWQLLYVLGSFIIASSFLGQWQVLVVERSSRKLRYNVQNIYQKIFANDKFLVSETFDLNELKQIKSNISNGTISFYHSLSTINVYVGRPEKCEAMLAKFKAMLPGSPAPCSEDLPREQTDKDSSVSEESLDDEERDDGVVVEARDDGVVIEARESVREFAAEKEDKPREEDAESKDSGDAPRASPGLDDVKEDDDGLSSDDSFVKIDNQEVVDASNYQDATPTEVKFVCGDGETPSGDGDAEAEEPPHKPEN